MTLPLTAASSCAGVGRKKALREPPLFDAGENQQGECERWKAHATPPVFSWNEITKAFTLKVCDWSPRPLDVGSRKALCACIFLFCGFVEANSFQIQLLISGAFLLTAAVGWEMVRDCILISKH